MKKQLLCLLLSAAFFVTSQVVEGQDLIPVYQVDTLTTFDKLGPDFESVIYDGAIWKRRVGNLPLTGQADRFIEGPEGSYYERQLQGLDAARINAAVPEDDFYKVNSIQELRNLSSDKIANVQNNIVKGVQVLGYYTAGDTPDPINYYLSATNALEDGGSVIVVNSSIKWVHNFNGKINPVYFGSSNSDVGLTQALISKPNTTFVITDTLNLKGGVRTLAPTSNLLFQGGALKNGTIKNGFISIQSVNIIAERNFKLYGSYAFLSNDVTINADYHDSGSYTVESNDTATIAIGQVAFYNADVTFRNCRIVKGLGAFKFLNDGGSKKRTKVNFENCTIRQNDGNITNSDDTWAIVIGTIPADKGSKNEEPHVKFTSRNTTFENIGLAVYEADSEISRCDFKAGANNDDNRELLHLGGGGTRQVSYVTDCVFDANGRAGDLVDTFNSSNKVIERCRFKGGIGKNYITIKSHINGTTGIDSDQIGAQGNIVVSNCLFEGHASRDFGAVAIYNDDRQNNTIPFPDVYKRHNVKVTGCTFKLEIPDSIENGNHSAAIALGSARFASITDNTVLIPGMKRSVLVNLLYQASEDIIISGNMLRNEDATSTLSSKLIGVTIGAAGTLRNSIIDNNIVQQGFIFGDQRPWGNLAITNNSFTKMFNGATDALAINCYRAGNKSSGVFSDNYGNTRPVAASVPPGFSYFDTTTGKLFRRMESGWVEVGGQ